MQALAAGAGEDAVTYAIEILQLVALTVVSVLGLMSLAVCLVVSIAILVSLCRGSGCGKD